MRLTLGPARKKYLTLYFLYVIINPSDEGNISNQKGRHMERNYSVEVICRCCHHLYTIKVNPRDYHNWAFGRTLTQVAFPYLSNDERELLISETCNDCWNKIFGEEEDE